MRASSILLSPMLLCVWLVGQAVADAKDAVDNRQKPQVAVELPISEPLSAEWVVIVHEGTMQILPASSRQTGDTVVVTAPFEGANSDTLRAAVVRTKDGRTLTSVLKP
ncbi:MAG: hypothetical protein EBZ48_08795 [Proteobacteria bacterium]|nr:hypothetical protein [Pseudomonadota bacterium]